MSNQSKHFKKHSSDFKLKIVLKYLSEKFTITEICVEFGISKATLHNWVMQFKACSSAVFNVNKACDKNKEKQQKEITNLCAKIGELTVERDFLKKVLDA